MRDAREVPERKAIIYICCHPTSSPLLCRDQSGMWTEWRKSGGWYPSCRGDHWEMSRKLCQNKDKSWSLPPLPCSAMSHGQNPFHSTLDRPSHGASSQRISGGRSVLQKEKGSVTGFLDDVMDRYQKSHHWKGGQDCFGADDKVHVSCLLLQQIWGLSESWPEH